jgi:hypothetical protein
VAASPSEAQALELLLLTCTQLNTFIGPRRLTAANGFFFQRRGQLFLITSRHVLLDPAAEHRPQRVEFALHGAGPEAVDDDWVSLPLYDRGRALWRQVGDGGGDVDVAALEIPLRSVPRSARFCAFTARHIQPPLHAVQLGQSLTLVGFPIVLGSARSLFPVAHDAVLASAFGVHYQGQGCFLTDGPQQHAKSGAPVVRPDPYGDAELPWQLLGVHAAGQQRPAGNSQQARPLGLHRAWYSDVLLSLTQ